MKFRIPYAVPFITRQSAENVAEAISESEISGSGKFTRLFEQTLNHQIDSKYGFTVSNGSAALRLALLNLNADKHSRIILPAWAFHVAANISFHFGAKLEFLDVNDKSWCLNEEGLIEVDNLNEKDILVLVHTLGNCSNLTKVEKLQKEKGFRIIEDSAESLYSKYQGRNLGTIFDIGTYSFHAAKTISCGEGGFITFKSRFDYEKGLLTKNQGMSSERPYFHQIAGDNLRMSNLLAALALPQLAQKEYIFKERIRVYERYSRNLNVSQLSFISPTDINGFFPWGVGIRFRGDNENIRDEKRHKLALNGIDSRPGFTSAKELPYVRDKSINLKHDISNSEQLAKETLLLPHYPTLTNSQIDEICELVI